MKKEEFDFVYKSYFEDNQYDKEKNINYVVPENIKNPWTLNYFEKMCLSDEKRGGPAHALQLFDAAIKFDSIHSPFSYYYYAMLLLDQKKIEAEHFLVKAREIFCDYKTRFT